MGAWGVLAFDNDDACDWTYGLEEVNDLSYVELALSNVFEANDYLEAPAGSEALAACEVLARLLGRPGYHNVYTELVDEWVKQHPSTPSPKLIARALAAIDRVLGENSELRQLWDDADPTDWLRAVDDLRSRLTQ